MLENCTYDDFISEIEKLESKIACFEKESDECNTLKREIQNASALSTQLYEKYHNKYGVINTVETRHYSMEELAQIREELADTSILTLLKRFFGIGKKNDEIYAELMGKLKGLLVYLNEQLEDHRKMRDKAHDAMKISAVLYEKKYTEIQKLSGCTPDTDWGRYSQPEKVSGNLYLGDIEVATEVEIHHAQNTMRECMPGSYVSDMLRVPYTRSLLETLHLLYDYRKESSIQAVQSVKALLYQIIRMTPAYYMELHLMDGANTGADFSDIIDLQKVRENEVIQLNRKVTGGKFQLLQLYFEDATITEGLRKLDQYMTLVAEEMGAYDSLQNYNSARQSEKAIIPYQIVVIQNFPTGFTDEDIKILDKLIRNGQKRGISIIILNDQDHWLEMQKKDAYAKKTVSLQDKISREAMLTLDIIRLSRGNANLTASDCSSICRLQLMRTGRPDYIRNVVKVKTSIQETDNYFPHVFDIEAPFGQMDSLKGLRIPFALDRRGRIMEYCLGESMNAHGLISGGTGSGKSTLLHMLISSIVMNYSPDDVEIWLADYKITEFYTYKTNTPPHIRFIGLSKTADFSYAFIDKITEEMNRRQSIIAEADFQLKTAGEKTNVTDFNKYREIFGITSLRRLLIIIDEFHVMAQFAQKEPDYKEKLENLLAEARALGIILLFSDQAIVDGLRGLSEKGRKQIKARIAMSNYLDELKETLVGQDAEALKPYLNMQTGDIAIQTVDEDEKDNTKTTSPIERGKVIYIDGEWRYKVNERARSLYQAEEYVPDSFDDRVVEAVDWDAIQEWENAFLKPHRNGDRDMQIYLGRPIDLEFSTHFPLLQRKGNNIMSVAGTEEQQMQIFSSVVGSFCRQSEYEIIVMTDPYASLYREYGTDIQMMSGNIPNMTVYEELEDICYQTSRLLGIMNDRGNRKKILVIWLGLDTIADLLADENDRKPEALKKMEIVGAKAAKKKEEKIMDTNPQSELDKLFSSLFGDDAHEKDSDPYAEESGMEETEESSYLYNAANDISKILHLGPTRNVYNMVIYDSAAALKDFRGARISDFNHKIAFVMSDNEASDFLERSNLIRSMPERMAYYYNGRSGKKFIPYKL